ncbi:MAG: carbohydrate ABC transporter permease [Caldiserica bacterium]|nr:MAG: carbohydrate ABC transporter permease [Caldisericota bacterium]
MSKILLKARFEKVKVILVSHLICILVTIACIFPLVWMVSSSLKTQETVFKDFSLIPKSPHFKNYLIAIKEANFGIYFLNSVFYTATVVLAIIFLSSMAAYAFSRLRFPLRSVFYIMLISTMMIPIPGIFIALYVLLNKLHLINTRIGYILCQINAGLPLSIFLFKTFMDKIPKELEEAAKVDGCNKFQIYWKIVFPLSRPTLGVIAIFNTLAVWNEYLLAMLVFSDKSLMPLQRGLMVFYGSHLTQYPLLMAGLTITTIPVLIVYFFMHRYIVSGIIAGALKG